MKFFVEHARDIDNVDSPFGKTRAMGLSEYYHGISDGVIEADSHDEVIEKIKAFNKISLDGGYDSVEFFIITCLEPKTVIYEKAADYRLKETRYDRQ